MEPAPVFSDEDLLDALLYVAPQITELFAQGDSDEQKPSAAEDMTSDELADIMSVFSSAEGGASSPMELLFGDKDQQPPSPKRTKVSRSRQLSDMRVMADALEGQLEKLKYQVYSEKPETGRFWGRIAQRMLVEKRLAMRENARLRVLLRQQVASVHVLHSAFALTPELAQDDITPARYRSPPKLPKKIYQTLLANVEASFSNVGSMFSHETLMDSRRKISVEMVSQNGLDKICVHVEEAKAVPLGFVHAADQVWAYLSRVNEGERQKGFHRVFRKRGDHLFGESELKCSSNAKKLNGYVVMRRFVEEKRVTIVWESVGTCETGSDTVICLPMQEKGWVFFDPSPEDANTTICRCCVHFTPQVLTSSSQALKACAKDFCKATELVLGVYENTVGYIYEALVSSMLNDMRLR